jgi:hypothetical protein
LRAGYDEEAQRIASALRALFEAVASSDLRSARLRLTEVETGVESAVRTAMRAQELVRAKSPAGRRRSSKSTARQRRQNERFWTRQLMDLVELRSRLAWIALDPPGLVVPTPLAQEFSKPMELGEV